MAFAARRAGAAAATAAALALTLALAPGRRPPAGTHPAGHPAPPITVVAFYENSPRAYSSFLHYAGHISTLSPRWYLVTAAGAVENIGYDARVVQLAHARHTTVVPLVNNLGDGMLVDPTARRQAVDRLAALVRAGHLDGLNVDFELLPAKDRPALTAFVTDLGQALRPLHKIVAVSVFPLVGVPTSINGAYNYPALAAWAHYLVIMAYDHHYSGGPPGPVAPYSWVAENVRAALRQAPAAKLVLGIGAYGYDWSSPSTPGPAQTVPDTEVPSLAARYHATIVYLRRESQSVFSYTKNGVMHVVYFMGNRSAAVRVALARQHHLRGVALWQLGYEQPGFWRAVGKAVRHP